MSKQRFGKYFLLQQKSNPHLVLEIKDGEDRPDAVVMAGELEGGSNSKDHQLWFMDETNHIIRSKLNKFCLDLKNDSVVVNPFIPGNTNQNWIIDCEQIRNYSKRELVVGLQEDANRSTSSSSISRTSPCVASASKDSIDQRWTVECQPALFFYVKSHDDHRQVLDIRGADSKAGAKVITYGNKGDMADNQLWYEDNNGIIRSKLNDFVLDASGKEVMMLPYDKNSLRQQWIISGDQMQNRLNADEVLQLKPGSLLCRTCLVPVVKKSTSTSTLHLWSFEFIPDQISSLSHSGCGKHFTIRSLLSGLVFEVQGKMIEAGSEVALAFHSKDSSLSSRQHFYVDEVTGTIRSILRNYCVDLGKDDHLVINPFDPYKKNQQWRIVGNKIQNRHDLNSVLQVSNASTDVGSRITADEYVGGDQQHFDVTHVPAKFFYIVSLLTDKVLDVRGEKSSAGSSVILYERKSDITPNQLWYEDEHGIVRSKLNGYVLDSSENIVKMRPYDPSNKRQQWIIVGDRIQNKYDSKMVIDIGGESKRNGATLIEYKFHGAENQRWKFDYVK